MTYEIVKGLTVKTNQRNSYPFGDMLVNDAFYLSREDKDKVVPAASYYGSRNGIKFSIRKYASDKYPDGYACIRVA